MRRTTLLVFAFAMLFTAFCTLGQSTQNDWDFRADLPACDTLATPLFPGYPSAVAPEGFGVNYHNVQGPDLDKGDLQQIANLGFRYVRDDMRWEVVETQPGLYDFSSYIQQIQIYKALNLRPFFILNYSNPLYEANPRSINTEQGRQAFATFAARAVELEQQHDMEGVIWEIWNEPNDSQLWQPSVVDAYYALIETTVQAMRTVDPDAVIIAPASALDFDFLEALFNKGLLNLIDGVSVHPYQALSPPENVVDGYTKLRVLIAQYAPEGRAIPIVNSEWGYAIADMNQKDYSAVQARFFVREFLVNMWQDVPVQMWFTWRRSIVSTGTDYSILATDRMPRPVYFSAGVLFKQLKGYRFLKRLPSAAQDEYYMLFSNCHQFMVVSWLNGGSWVDAQVHDVRLPLPSGSGELVTMNGESQQATWDSQGLPLKLSSDPQYLKFNTLGR